MMISTPFARIRVWESTENPGSRLRNEARYYVHSALQAFQVATILADPTSIFKAQLFRIRLCNMYTVDSDIYNLHVGPHWLCEFRLFLA